MRISDTFKEVRVRLSGMVPLILLLVLVAAFFLPWFNRFAGIRSGAGEFSGGMSLLAGKVPYRDFFNPGPPLNAVKAAMLLQVFGRSLFVLRLAALAERLLLAGMLYHWLSRFVPRRAAWIASAVTIILSAGDRTDPLASYNHDAILLGMAAAMCLDALAAWRTRSAATGATRLIATLLAAGALTGCCALTKQTVGGCCLLFFVAWLWFTWEHTSLHTIQALACYLAGVLLPVLLVATWLWHEGALAACVRMTLVQGPSAKAGSPLDFVLRTFLVAYDNAGWVFLGGFLLLLAAGPLVRSGKALRAAMPQAQDEVVFVPFAIFSLAILFAVLLSYTRLPTLHDQGKSAVYFALFALPLVSLMVGRLIVHKPSRLGVRLLLFAGTGLAAAFSLSLSWPAFEAMLLPGLALPLALALNACGRRAGKYVVALLAFAVFLQTREKLDLPFGFDYQVEAAVADAKTPSTLPLLRGMRLPVQTVRFLDETTALVQHCLQPRETVFTYPEMGLVYALSGAGLPTLSPSHNIDVVNDSFARQEALRLAANPPRVLVFYRETEAEASGAERLWRRGRPSGQREIAATVERLLPQYRRVGSYRLREGNPEIGVYLLPAGLPMTCPAR